MTFEEYLKKSAEDGAIDHSLRATVAQDGTVSLYVHPSDQDGDTVDFVVVGNELRPNPTVAPFSEDAP